jgi:hypothetical protein
MCPGCQAIGEVDLRALDRHPAMPISGLISLLSCGRCCPNEIFHERGLRRPIIAAEEIKRGEQLSNVPGVDVTQRVIR